MFDVKQFFWVVDRNGCLSVASGPSAQSPVCVSSGVSAEPGPPMRLSERQAVALQQAAADARQAPLTFLHSNEGVTLIKRMLHGELIVH